MGKSLINFNEDYNIQNCDIVSKLGLLNFEISGAVKVIACIAITLTPPEISKSERPNLTETLVQATFAQVFT